jgi:hypothetical protein
MNQAGLSNLINDSAPKASPALLAPGALVLEFLCSTQDTRPQSRLLRVLRIGFEYY